MLKYIRGDFVEIERKFLVSEIPCLDSLKYSKIEQGYISFSPETRIRKKDDKYYLTKKGEGMIVREEIEIEVSPEEGQEYFNKVISKLIKKTRYYIPYGKYTIELDIYEGELEGLVVAEVEFETEREAGEFLPPDWFCEDISEKIEYRNKILAIKG